MVLISFSNLSTIIFLNVSILNCVLCLNVRDLKLRPPPIRASQLKCDEYAKASQPDSDDDRIVSGKKADAMEFPHMIRIAIETRPGKIFFQCGASLISDSWLLTAAHCMDDETYGLVKYARIGELEFKDGNESNEFEIQLNDYLIVEHVIYPEYDVDGFGYDIALLRLNRKVENIPPVCLAEQFLPTINIVIATGWGDTRYAGENSKTLLKVDLELFTQDECSENYSIDDSQICAGTHSDDGKSTCSGDSGGPIQIQHPHYPDMYEIIGLTSYGRGCGSKDVPIVFTRVFSYLDWIEQHVWPNEYHIFSMSYTTTPNSVTIEDISEDMSEGILESAESNIEYIFESTDGTPQGIPNTTKGMDGTTTKSLIIISVSLFYFCFVWF